MQAVVVFEYLVEIGAFIAGVYIVALIMSLIERKEDPDDTQDTED